MTDKFELEEKIKKLVGLEKRYYEFIPDTCWMSEQTQADGLKVGRSKIRTVKRNLAEQGLIQIEIAPNGKRHNLKHIVHKSFPIILEESAREYLRYSAEDDEYYYQTEIDWHFFKQHTAQDINGMEKLDKIHFYMKCGFLVLPTHYPIFTDDGVKCSCKDGFVCPHKGKHPIHRYKFIDGLNYDNVKEIYLKEFEHNPNLNIGFKVMGYSVLDVDNRNSGNKTLESLIYEYDIDFNHTISVNCSNGQHIYASNKYLKNTAGFLGEGLDIRSEGGFVVAPGSLHQSGKFYEWKQIGELATMPNEWFEADTIDEEVYIEGKTSNGKNLIARRKLEDIKLPSKLTSDYVIRVGERELTLFKFACRERGKGATAERIYDILLAIRDNHCEIGNEPVKDEEIRIIAESAAKYLTNSEKRAMSRNAQNN